MRGIRRVRWVSLVAVVMVSACTGGRPDPTATTAPVTVSSSSVSTSATRPASATTSAGGTSTTAGTSATGVPPEAQVDSADGAVAFVKFVVAEVNRAYKAADVTILPTLLAPECLGCKDLTDDLSETAGKKQRVVGEIWTVQTAMVNTWEPGQGTVALAVAQNGVDYVDELGRKVNTAETGSFRYLLTVRRAGQSWRVVRWQQVA